LGVLDHRQTTLTAMNKSPLIIKWTIILRLPLVALFVALSKNILLSTNIIDIPILLLNAAQVEASYILDYLRIVILSLVRFISINVIIFSHYYLHDSDNKKFYTILVLFITSMYVFSTSHNLIRLLLGWDGLGISRFILVAHYPTSTRAGRSIVTIFTNRIGDVFLIITLYFLLKEGQWGLSYLNSSTLILSLILVGLAAATKRAHVPFNLWLPEAIAAPTPVSALVHSSTLVTAGIILLIRTPISNYKILTLSIWALGTITTIIAGVVASYIEDPKKIIAYSTISQLGIISIALGINLPAIALFHLVTHAIFKALIFISIGLVITQTKHKQIITSSFSFSWASPTIYLKIATLALNAFPFTAGFFSKDLILEFTICYWAERFTILLLTPISLTALYRLRLIKLTSSIKIINTLTRGRSNNKHSLSVIRTAPTTLQSLIAVSIGVIIGATSLNESLLFISTFQTTTILFITISGLTILTLIASNPRYSITPNNMKFFIHSNFSSWWTLEAQNYKTLSNAKNLYKIIEKGYIINFVEYTFSSFIKLSFTSLTTAKYIKTIIIIGLLTVMPIIIF